MGKASRSKRERRLENPRLPENVPASLRTRDQRVVRNLDRSRISESLAELVRPFTTDETDIEEFRALVGLAAIAWNLAVLGDSTARKALQLLEDRSINEREVFEDVVFRLVLRKRELFPGDRRVVAGWEVVARRDGTFFLTAASVGTRQPVPDPQSPRSKE
jgi:hypothetical protein